MQGAMGAFGAIADLYNKTLAKVPGLPEINVQTPNSDNAGPRPPRYPPPAEVGPRQFINRSVNQEATTNNRQRTTVSDNRRYNSTNTYNVSISGQVDPKQAADEVLRRLDEKETESTMGRPR